MPSNLTNRPTQPALASRFDGRSDAYKHWRDQRLLAATQTQHNVVELDPGIVPDGKTDTASGQHYRQALSSLCQRLQTHGFALYRLTSSATTAPALEESRLGASALAHQLGLDNVDDGVIRDAGKLSLLQDLSGTPRSRFIPYTRKAMNWHTDGYYNDADSAVRCFTLHCVCPAQKGGSLTMMDPELLLIALQENSPDCVDELCRPDAMSLPANSDEQGHNRPDRAVPVFFCDSNNLGMRFTTRTEHIHWHSAPTEQAARHVVDIIEASKSWHTRVRLQAGEGIITRNVLHKREAFADSPGSPGRQILRGRYLQLPCAPGCITGGPSRAARQ